MRVLIMTSAYPSGEKPYNLAYVHSRVLHYQQRGWQTQVLSFSAVQPYIFEGVEVSSEDSLDPSSSYDLVIAHAPNLRHHLRWLMTHAQRWRKMLWVIHGHEVLIQKDYYPPPYPWDPKNKPWRRVIEHAYDHLKVRILGQLIPRWLQRRQLHVIFVSQWIREQFERCVPLPQGIMAGHYTIVPNNLHPAFLNHQRTSQMPFYADFVTIRPLDELRYSIDVVSELARRYPQFRFDVYGTGRYFEFHPPPPNLTWHQRFLVQAEIPALLDHYRAALMPTRFDTQGVMSCEMASLGMPILTADMAICQEMLGRFQRARFFKTDPLTIDLPALLAEAEAAPVGPLDYFHDQHTILREIEVIQTFATK
jgi:glycosyltransferase involved in cell wall biosynthesis